MSENVNKRTMFCHRSNHQQKCFADRIFGASIEVRLSIYYGTPFFKLFSPTSVSIVQNSRLYIECNDRYCAKGRELILIISLFKAKNSPRKKMVYKLQKIHLHLRNFGCRIRIQSRIEGFCDDFLINMQMSDPLEFFMILWSS